MLQETLVILSACSKFELIIRYFYFVLVLFVYLFLFFIYLFIFEFSVLAGQRRQKLDG